MRKIVALLMSLTLVMAVLPMGTFAYIENDGSGVNYTFSDCTSPTGVAYADGAALKAALGGGPWWSIGTFNGNPATDNYAGTVRLDSSKFGGKKALRVERTSTSGTWGDIGVKYDMPAAIAAGTGDIIVAETTVVPTWTGTSNGASVFYFEAVDSSGTMIARIFGKSGRILNYKTNTQSADKPVHTGAFLLEDGEYTIKMSLNLSANTAEFSISAPRTSASGAAAGSGFSVVFANGVETLKTTTPIPLKSSGTHADVKTIRFGYGGYTGAAYYKNILVGKEVIVHPTITSVTDGTNTVITSGETGISSSIGQLNLNFDAAMVPNTFDGDNVKLVPTDDMDSPVAYEGTLSSNGKRYTMTLPSLASGKEYRLILKNLTDTNGDALAYTSAFTFTTTAPILPEVVDITMKNTSASIPDGADLPQSTGGIVIKFNNAMNAGTLTKQNIMLKYGRESIDYTGKVSSDNKSYTLSFLSPLDVGEYTLHIDAENVTDIGGYSLSGFTPFNFTVVSAGKVNIFEDFQNDNKYAENMTGAGISALVPSWSIHNGTGDIKIGIANVGPAPKSLLIGQFVDTVNADNPYVEIPISPQTGVLQVEYAMLTPGGGPQPYFEAYGEGQKRVRLAGPDRQIVAVQNLDNDKDYTKNILIWGQGKDFRHGTSNVTTFRYVMDIPNKKYDLYITNTGINTFNSNLVSPAENIGGNTVVRRNIPLLGDAITIDKLKFGGVRRDAVGDIFTFALQNIKVTNVTTIKSVTTDKGIGITEGSSITSLTRNIQINFSDDMKADTLNAANIKLVNTSDNNANIAFTGSYDTGSKRYIITPTAPLVPNKNYKITLSELKDFQNNPVTNLSALMFKTNDIPFRIASARFLDDGNNPVTSIEGKTLVKAEVSFVNEYEDGKDVMVIVTQNDVNNEMRNIAVKTIRVNGDKTVTLPIQIINYTAGDKVRVMIWDNMGDMKGLFYELTPLH